MDQYNFDNFAQPMSSRRSRNYYRWKVFMNEKPDRLERVKQVEYRLHPSFPDPIRIVTDRNSKFALISSGWGEFEMEIVVHEKTGEKVLQTYYLRLLKNVSWPKDESDFDTVKTEALNEYEDTINRFEKKYEEAMKSQIQDYIIQTGFQLLNSIMIYLLYLQDGGDYKNKNYKYFIDELWEYKILDDHTYSDLSDIGLIRNNLVHNAIEPSNSNNVSNNIDTSVEKLKKIMSTMKAKKGPTL